MSSSTRNYSVVRLGRALVSRLAVLGAVLAVCTGGLALSAAPAAAAVVTPFTADVNQALYGDYILAGNTVMTCPAGDTVCLAGQASNDSGISTLYTNDSFVMRYNDVDSDPSTFNSGTIRYKVPPGATILKARLWWGGNTGEALQLNGQPITACNGSRPNSGNVLPAVLPAVGGKPSTHAIKASVNGTSLGSLTPERYSQDLNRTVGGRHYAASRDVTSLLGSLATNTNLDLTVANIWTPTGYNCAGGFTLGVVWSYPSANATYAPKIRQVLMFDGFVAQGAADAPTITTLNGFTIAAGVTKIGVAVLEGDQAIQGDQLLVNNVAMSDPRTTPAITNNFYQSTVQGALNPTFANTFGLDTKSINVPAGLVNPGDTQVLLKFTTAGDQYFPYMFAMSAPITSTFLTGTVWADTNRNGAIDTGEIGLPGVTVTLTKPDGSTITTTTASDGTYRFDGLTVGSYTITETQPTGYGSSTPNAISSVAVPATGLSNQNFGDTLGSISGTVYNDVDKGGALTAGDAGIGGVTVYLTGTDASGRPVSATAVTATDGTYSFTGLPGGTYSVSEVQPGAFADSTDTAGTAGGTAGAAGTDLVSGLTLTNGTAATGYNFGETQTSLSGTVYLDANNDGTKSGAAEVGIGGVTVALSGTTTNGAAVSLTTTTAVDGSYSFLGLLPGTYTVTETQPAAYGDGLDTVGSAGGTVANDAITLTLGSASATAYNFGERGATVSGSVYLDTNADGTKNGAEAALPATTVTITLKDHSTGSTIATTTTAADGSYSFANVPAGSYDIVETQPAAYGSTTPNTLVSVNVPAGGSVTDQNFGEKASSIAGRVYLDTDANNAYTAGEGGVGNVTVTLKNSAGTTVATTVTSSDGTYSFTGLAAGTYTVVETQPSGYTDKAETAGTSGGNVTVNDTISAIVLAAGTDSTGNNFGEGGTIWSGTVYVDANASGTRDAGEAGISGATLTLQHAENNVIVCPGGYTSSYYGAPYGKLCNFNGGWYYPTSVTSVTWVSAGTTTTNASGAWSFSGLVTLVAGASSGVSPDQSYARYRVVETQPATYGDGAEQVGPGGATAPLNDTFEIFAMPANGLAGYNFGELGATVSGKVYEDLDNSNTQAASGEPGIASVTVTLKQGAATIATTLTDSSGNWSFGGLTTGAYTVVETQPVAYADGQELPGTGGATAPAADTFAVTLTAGSTSTGNLFGEGRTSISGSVFGDHNANGTIDGAGDAGIGGVTLTLTDSTGAVVATTTSDPVTGAYSFGNLLAGNYTVTETQPLPYGSSTPNVRPVTLPTTGLTGVDFGETFGSLSGKVYRDLNQNGVPNPGEVGIGSVTVTLTGTPTGASAITPVVIATAPDGTYTFPDLLAGSYTVTETQPSAFGDGLDTAGNAGGTVTNDVIGSVALAAGQGATAYNFGEVPAFVSGIVFVDANRDSTKNTGESTLGGITVTLKDSSDAIVATTTTLPDGSYMFANITADNYTVEETQPAGYGSSTPNSQPVTVPTGGLAGVNFGETSSSVAGAVFVDVNKNGIRDAGEPGIAGVSVTLTGNDAGGTPVVRTLTTAADGSYSFDSLLGGTYRIEELQPTGYSDGDDTMGSIAAAALRDDPKDIVSDLVLPADTEATGYLFGEIGTTIRGTVWYDKDQSGTSQPGEPGLAGKTITLLNSTGGVVATTTTDANGRYLFEGIPTGDYSVVETQPTGYGSSTPNTLNITVPPSGVTGVDFGDTLGLLSGRAYIDQNNNDDFTTGELGVPGVTVTLTGTDAAGASLSLTTLTGANGTYTFPELKAGTYVVTETQPVGFADAGDDAGTSGGTVANDTVSAIALTGGTNATDYNFGEHSIIVAGTVYLDRERNSTIDPTDKGLGGVTVELWNGSTLVATTTTNPDGSYVFVNVPLGSYEVRETQPTGYGSSTSDSVNITVPAAGVTGINFGDTLSTLAGTVYSDADNSGTKAATELGIADVTVTLTGTSGAASGTVVRLTSATDGTFSFADLLSGTYTLTEAQPSTYGDGTDKEGSLSGTTGNDVITTIVVPEATDGINYLFGEVGASITGTVYLDADRDHSIGATESKLQGVTITLRDSAGTVIATTTTDVNGHYSFAGLPNGGYTVDEATPIVYGSTTPDRVAVTVPVNGTAVADFGDSPSILAGVVYVDRDNNAVQASTEPGIAGATVTLDGVALDNTVVHVVTTTLADGSYSFIDLPAGLYTIAETQPGTYLDGLDTIGSAAGTLGNDVLSAITLDIDSAESGYNFGEVGVAISGTVWYDVNRDGVIDAAETARLSTTITLLDSANNVVATTTSDPTTGAYSFTGLGTGSYTVVETQPSGYGSSAATPNSQPVTLALTGVTGIDFGDTLSTLSGKIYNDLSNNGSFDTAEPGIGGVTVTLTKPDNTTVAATTATDGTYSFNNLPEGTYSVTETQPAAYNDGGDTVGSFAGTLGADTVTAIAVPTGQDGTTYNFGERGAAISGTVFYDVNRDGVIDATETARLSTTVTLLAADGVTVVATTTSDPTTGAYSFPNLPADDYTVVETQPVGYGSSVTTPNSHPVTLTVAGVTGVNFGDTLSTVSGTVFNDLNNNGTVDSGEPGIGGVTVTLTKPDNTTVTTTTATDGTYSFTDLPSGSYSVTETQPAAYNDGTDKAGSFAGTVGADTVTAISVPAGQDGPGYTFGELGAAISGTVFYDVNRDGMIDAAETARLSTTVTLLAADGVTVVATTTSDPTTGAYSFPNLPADDYTVVETQPVGYGSSVTTPNSHPVTLTVAGVTGVNFGDTLSTLSGTVFNDKNNNGAVNVGEPGISGVTVTLTKPDDSTVTTTTATDGSYSFKDLPAGTYVVTETQPVPYNDSVDTAGTFAGTVGEDTVTAITVPAGQDGPGYTFAEIGVGISGTVFYDVNRDGVIDATETARLSTTITLLAADGVTVVATTTSDPTTGVYSFQNLPAGSYTVVETEPVGYGSSVATPNSHAVTLPLTGVTGVNFGDTLSTVSGTVFNDLNNDGTVDSGEPGIGGVTVTLTMPDNSTVSTTTATDGSYSFTDLPSGTYVVSETQPAAYNDGTDTAGSFLGTVGADTVTAIAVPAGQDGIDYTFGELGVAISGTVFYDVNRDGTIDATETARLSTTITLLAADGVTVVATTTSDPTTGAYSFPNLPAGSYTVVETQPVGYGSSVATPNSHPVTLGLTGATGINFGDTLSTVSGTVFNDKNNNGAVDVGEPGISGVTVTLTMPDNTTVTTTSATDGSYSFTDLLAGTYVVTETQPAAYNDGVDEAGSFLGTVGADTVTAIAVPVGQDGIDYTFGELGAAISGTVFYDVNRDGVIDATETARLSTTVTLLAADGVTVVATTTSDPTTGAYSFPNLPAGDYTAVETQPVGYGSSVATPNSHPVTLALTGTTGVNFGDTLSTMSGSVYVDLNNDGVFDSTDVALSGITVTLTKPDATTVTTLTGVDGSYSFVGLPAGTYSVAESQPVGYTDNGDYVGKFAGTLAGTLGADSVTAIAVPAGQDGTGYQFTEKGAPISGMVFVDVNRDGGIDGIDHPLPIPVTIELVDPVTGAIIATTATDSTGRYAFSDLPPGEYIVREVQPVGYGSSTPNTIAVTLTPTGAAGNNFGDTLATVAGVVFHDANKNGVQDPDETGIAGVPVQLLDALGAPTGLTATTDSAGHYLIEQVVGGSYTVSETQPQAYGSSTPNDVSVSVAPASDVVTNFGDTTASITGTVFTDTNRDSTKTAPEKGLPGVTVTLTGTDVNDRPVTATKTTGTDGTFVFSNLPKGTYSITEIQPARYENGVNTPGTAGGTPCVTTPTVAPCNDTITTVVLPPAFDASGYLFAEYGGSIGNRVWTDFNDNGIQDADEPGIGGVTVKLYDADGTFYASTVTTGTVGASLRTFAATDDGGPGFYLFDDLPAGSYILEVNLTGGFVPTKTLGGGEDDSDFDGTTGRTSIVTLGLGQHRLDIDAGVVPPGTITGRVFIDKNRNGVHDSGEKPLANTVINLVDKNGTIIATTTTDGNGAFTFTNVPIGDYVVKEVQPLGYRSTTPDDVSVTVHSGETVIVTEFGENAIGLPVTGAQLAGMMLAAAALSGSGIVAVIAGRRRRRLA